MLPPCIPEFQLLLYEQSLARKRCLRKEVTAGAVKQTVARATKQAPEMSKAREARAKEAKAKVARTAMAKEAKAMVARAALVAMAKEAKLAKEAKVAKAASLGAAKAMADMSPLRAGTIWLATTVGARATRLLVARSRPSLWPCTRATTAALPGTSRATASR